jgi:H+/Cl- antiporter ClcA
VKDEHPQLKIWTSVVLVFAGVFCMVIARHTLRLIYLEGHFDPSHLPINPQWSVFAMFLITFIIGLGILYWMIRKYFHLPRQSA